MRVAIISIATLLSVQTFSAIAQDKPTARDETTAKRQSSENAQKVWAAMLRANPLLTGSDDFVKRLVEAVDQAGRVPEFGSEFVDLVEGRKMSACVSLKLCEAKIVPAYRISKPVGVVDLVGYLLKGTCYGFLPDEDNRINAIKLIEQVLIETGQPTSPISLGEVIFLRGELADMLATHRGKRSQSGLGRTPKLRAWMRQADRNSKKRPARGSLRPLAPEVREAAFLACKPISR